MDLAGRDPPFLAASGAYATFSNCLFRNVQLPRSELFDVSQAGTVTLLNCHFSNISTGSDLVDTSYNDYVPVGTDYRFRYYSNIEYLDYTNDRDVYGRNDHEAYDIALSPAPGAAASLYGSDYIVVNETLSDCLSVQFAGGDLVLPGCPQDSVQARDERYRTLDTTDDGIHSSPADGPGVAERLIANVTRELEERRAEERVKLANPFYAQYYDYGSAEYSYRDSVFSDEYDGNGPDGAAPYGLFSLPGPDYHYEDRLADTLGAQLSEGHPWFQAMVKVCPVLSRSCVCGACHGQVSLLNRCDRSRPLLIWDLAR